MTNSREFSSLFDHNLYSKDQNTNVHIDDESIEALGVRMNPEVVAKTETNVFSHEEIPGCCSESLKTETILQATFEGAVVYQEGNLVNGLGVIVSTSTFSSICSGSDESL